MAFGAISRAVAKLQDARRTLQGLGQDADSLKQVREAAKTPDNRTIAGSISGQPKAAQSA